MYRLDTTKTPSHFTCRLIPGPVSGSKQQSANFLKDCQRVNALARGLVRSSSAPSDPESRLQTTFKVFMTDVRNSAGVRLTYQGPSFVSMASWKPHVAL